jgi:hypothetical protein
MDENVDSCKCPYFPLPSHKLTPLHKGIVLRIYKKNVIKIPAIALSIVFSRSALSLFNEKESRSVPALLELVGQFFLT